MERYSRQVLFERIGDAGQRRLLSASVLIVVCGALGSAQAEALVRGGVGRLRIVDRDFVEESNLQRQTMFTEADARERLPKAIAARQHLRELNLDVEIEAEVADVNQSNIDRLIRGCELVLDGTDNFSSRYLINDASVKHGVNWIYGAAVGSYGATMTIRPGVRPCLRCIFEEAPPAASSPTCDTSGVIMPIISIVAAVQVTEALKLITGQHADLHDSLMSFDVWSNEWKAISLRDVAPSCVSCTLRSYPALEPDAADFATQLCGRDAIQISPRRSTRIDLKSLAERFRASGAVQLNPYLLRFRTGDVELTIFSDARAIIRGAEDITAARSLYARYIGI